MKFEKLKRFYEIVDEFGFEVILEIQNLAVPCKFKPNKKIGELLERLDKELNPFINEKIKLDYKFTVVHENVWDNRAKVVFVNAAEYKKLESSNLIMDSVDLLIN